ncbi:MAG: 2-hydroxychromene-2-carboxylate isomerase [Rhizobiales bacterium]|jgi:2-hydroxychromene-2-carboxylate isomerase|nr:2-hydroxychromene-2-carboxylate isomerase [Hyphomicrobiales bacterium]
MSENAGEEAITTVDWYFDLISPFAFLQLNAFGRLPKGLKIVPKPVLLGALLRHWGQLGPAEIGPKRLHTYRLAQFIASERGLNFTMPERHPFNPLKALRMLAALGPDLQTVRRAFDFVFVEGRAPDTDEAIEDFGRYLLVSGAAIELAGEQSAKDRLRQLTDEAIGRGVFGVPTFHLDGELFWGDDATGMLAAYLNDRSLFRKGEMARIATLPVGIQRNTSRS